MPSPRAIKPLSASKAAKLYYHTDKNRSLRSIILDAKRPRQQSKTLSRGERKSWRYSSRNGVRNWDFRGVDDGSPKALRRLERFLSTRRPSPTARRSSSPKRAKKAKSAKRSPSPKLVQRSPSPKLVKRSASPAASPAAKQSPEKEFFARGREGLVYKRGKNIVKEFLPNVPTAAFERQVDFLRENSQSGVVPKLINVDRKNRIIEMEYLDGYVSLKEALAKVKKRKSEAEMSKLILALKQARERLRTDYDYADLSNFGNIAVKLGDKLGDKIKVKFFEGGKANRVRGTRDTVAELWLRKVVHEMKVSRNPVAKAVLNSLPLPAN